jgi:hypothetical protein
MANEQIAMRKDIAALALTPDAIKKAITEFGPINVTIPAPPNNSPWSDKALKKFRDDLDRLMFPNETANKK